MNEKSTKIKTEIFFLTKIFSYGKKFQLEVLVVFYFAVKVGPIRG